MASLKFCLFVFVLLQAVFMLSELWYPQSRDTSSSSAEMHVKAVLPNHVKYCVGMLKPPMSKYQYTPDPRMGKPDFPNITLIIKNDEKKDLLKNINAYRTLFLDLPAFTKNKKANCLANEIADRLDQSCNETTPFDQVKLDSYPDQLMDCLGTDHATDAVVMPVCAADKSDEVALLHNYTRRNQYKKSIKDSSYTGAGVGSNDNWMVVVLNKNTSIWSSSAGTDGLVSGAGAVSLFLGILFYLVL